MQEIKVIGLGGIGTHLIGPLCRYLESSMTETRITLIDGDSFESGNAERQDFPALGNKALVTAHRIKNLFPNLRIEAKPWYITEENAFLCIKDGDVVFLCVDNHKTRKLVCDRLSELNEALLISGGNEYADGNIQVYVRREGKDVCPPITYLHPEIETPKDRSPAEMSCEELSKSGAPQLIFTNLVAAAWMLSAFWLIINQLSGEVPYSEQYFDLKTGMARSAKR